MSAADQIQYIADKACAWCLACLTRLCSTQLQNAAELCRTWNRHCILGLSNDTGRHCSTVHAAHLQQPQKGRWSNVQLLTDPNLQVHVLPEMPQNSWHSVAAVWAE